MENRSDHGGYHGGDHGGDDRPVGRRALLGAVAGASLLAACGSDDGAETSGTGSSTTSTTGASTTTGESTTTSASTANTPPGPPPGGGPGGASGGGGAPTMETVADQSGGECLPNPPETAGPYPGDGSKGPDILSESGVVREDITSSLGGGNTAAGVPMTINLTVVDNAKACAPLANAAVYLWHADSNGSYSMYSSGVENETYLRGVQSTDAAGKLTFTSIFPGCYDGRWPHIHYEVYASEADATGGGPILLTSQIALPEAMCKTVYADSRYADSTSNLSRITLATDNVFSDGWDLELASASGDATKGVTISLNVSV